MMRGRAQRSRGGLGLGLGAAVVALGTFAGCSTPGDDPGPPLAVDPAAIYSQMCARCHGGDGRGHPEMKKTLPVRDFSDPAFQARTAASSEEITRVIMAGKNQMPAFGGMLSAPKIQSLAGYVRRLGRAAPAGSRPAAAAAAAPGAPSPPAAPPPGGAGP
jgi:mono/diheme cytochrome c family protein